jgi:hypothetical protein
MMEFELLKARNQDYVLNETMKRLGPSNQSLLARLTGLNPETVRNRLPSQKIASEERSGEYEYTAEMKAFEAFRNVMRREEISLSERDGQVTFRSRKFFDMKTFKKMGLLWSYTITRVKTRREIIEEG